MPIIGEGAGGRLLRMPQDRLIAVGRLVLAAASLLAIYVDPLQPSRAQALAYGILVGYVLFAILVLLRSIRLGARTGSSVVHLVDIVVIGSLMVFTEGPTSPFFVFFSFILLSATLRWEWRGALIAGAFLTVLYGGLTAFQEIEGPADADTEVNRIVVRAFYLLVASGLFAYFGAYRERSRRQLEMLAAWPVAAATDAPPLREPMAHAAGILGVPRILVVWEEAEEPYIHLAENAPSGYRHDRLPPDSYPGLGDMLLDQRVFPIGADKVDETGVDRAFVRDFAVAPGVTAPFATDRVRGRVFLVDYALTGAGELALAAIVAHRIGSELEHHLARDDMQRRSATDERMRLARQLHDGMLQSVTAARLQIVLASGQVDGEVKQRIEQVSELLGDEQRQLREFVHSLGSDAGEPPSG